MTKIKNSSRPTIFIGSDDGLNTWIQKEFKNSLTEPCFCCPFDFMTQTEQWVKWKFDLYMNSIQIQREIEQTHSRYSAWRRFGNFVKHEWVKDGSSA